MNKKERNIVSISGDFEDIEDYYDEDESDILAEERRKISDLDLNLLHLGVETESMVMDPRNREKKQSFSFQTFCKLDVSGETVPSRRETSGVYHRGEDVVKCNTVDIDKYDISVGGEDLLHLLNSINNMPLSICPSCRNGALIEALSPLIAYHDKDFLIQLNKTIESAIKGGRGSFYAIVFKGNNRDFFSSDAEYYLARFSGRKRGDSYLCTHSSDKERKEVSANKIDKKFEDMPSMWDYYKKISAERLAYGKEERKMQREMEALFKDRFISLKNKYRENVLRIKQEDFI